MNGVYWSLASFFSTRRGSGTSGSFRCGIDILLFYQLHFFEQLFGLSNLYEAVNKPVLKGDLLIQVSLYFI